MTNFNEELRNIVEQIHCGTCECAISGLSYDQAISAITSLVKGIVPKELNIDNKSKYQTGFNSCRSEMLKRIE